MTFRSPRFCQRKSSYIRCARCGKYAQLFCHCNFMIRGHFIWGHQSRSSSLSQDSGKWICGKRSNFGVQYIAYGRLDEWLGEPGNRTCELLWDCWTTQQLLQSVKMHWLNLEWGNTWAWINYSGGMLSWTHKRHWGILVVSLHINSCCWMIAIIKLITGSIFYPNKRSDIFKNSNH